jgi:hypothetical protein
VRPSNSLDGSASTQVLIRSGVPVRSGDPNPSSFDLRRKWGKTDVGWVMADGRPRRSDHSGSVGFRTQKPDRIDRIISYPTSAIHHRDVAVLRDGLEPST